MKKLLFFAFALAVIGVVGCQPQQPVVVQPQAQPQQQPSVQNNYYNARPQNPPVIVQPQSPPIIVAPQRPPAVIVVPGVCPHCKGAAGPHHRCPPGTHIGVGPGGVDINIRR